MNTARQPGGYMVAKATARPRRPSRLPAAAPTCVRRCFPAPRCEHLTPFQGSRPSGCATCSVDWAMPTIFSDASRRACRCPRLSAPRNHLPLRGSTATPKFRLQGWEWSAVARSTMNHVATPASASPAPQRPRGGPVQLYRPLYPTCRSDRQSRMAEWS